MRKIILKAPLLFVLFLMISQGSFSIARPIVSENYLPAVNRDYLRASVFASLSAKEFGELTGKKLNLPQRVYFKVIQRRLRHELKENPDLLITRYYDPKKAKFKFDALWFVIAGFIGPIGLLLAYTSKQRKGGPTKKNKITSAWLGFIFFVLWFGFSFIF
ncbi:MAG: hypothetical protein M3015_01675 [Bacteroidota bacterium]|nr:hypothetical protein [Bacteroidota bacterium]